MNGTQLLGLVWEKSRLNLKSEATINYLSYLWWIVEPVIHMATYYIVFAVLLHRGGDGYVYLLLVGLIPWLWFARTINQGSNSLIEGRHLMNQVSIPKLFFPLVFVTQCGVKQVMVFGILLLFLFVTGIEVTWFWLASVVVMFVQLIFIIPVACLLAVAVAFFRDMRFVIPTVIQFLFFTSGVFFSFDDVSQKYKALFLVNPMAGLIHAYRDTLLYQRWPDWWYLAGVAAVSFMLLTVVMLFYKRYEFHIARLVQE